MACGAGTVIHISAEDGRALVRFDSGAVLSASVDSLESDPYCAECPNVAHDCASCTIFARFYG
jgi:hypothetical protein